VSVRRNLFILSLSLFFFFSERAADQEATYLFPSRSLPFSPLFTPFGSCRAALLARGICFYLPRRAWCSDVRPSSLPFSFTPFYRKRHFFGKGCSPFSDLNNRRFPNTPPFSSKYLFPFRLPDLGIATGWVRTHPPFRSRFAGLLFSLSTTLERSERRLLRISLRRHSRRRVLPPSLPSREK